MMRDLVLIFSGYLGGVLLMAWFGREASQAECGDCAAKDREAARLNALVESRTQQLGQWMTRADQAERRLEELWMEHCEDAARKQHSFEIISERTKAIDAARAKCGPDFTGIVGTERDPVYLTRPNIQHDDVAYVATIAELCGGEGAGA